MSNATAVADQEFRFTLHASRQDEFLALTSTNLPGWLGIDGLTLQGTPATNQVATNALQLVVEDLYDQSRVTNTLTLAVGYSHDVNIKVPAGVEVKVGGAKQDQVTVSGIDKQAVGELAAVIRSSRKPEPYQGKGVRYQGEYIFRKEGKKK